MKPPWRSAGAFIRRFGVGFLGQQRYTRIALEYQRRVATGLEQPRWMRLYALSVSRVGGKDYSFFVKLV